LLLVPFYRKPELVEPFFSSLRTCGQELMSLGSTVVVINDSPEDPELTVALRTAIQELQCVVSCRLFENPHNIGFVKSANRGLGEAVLAGADVVLLNSDTILYRNAITEMRRVAYADSMIGFVSPRSNNATICSFPHQEEFRKVRPAEAYGAFCELSPYLPDFHYVPTAVGFCMFIKLEILKEFGLFDEAYGKGYNEENDLVMRANRCGYRAALANRAYVYHLGESSFSVSETPKSVHEERNAALLASRYPEYLEHVHAYLRSGHYRAEILLRGLLKDSHSRYDIVFDFSTFGPYHNGTFEAAKQILIHAAESWRDIFNIYVLIDEEPARFHGLHTISGIYRVPTNTSAVFAIAFRFGQPFQFDVIARMSQLAAINVYSMLDPIAWDCLYLNRDDLDEMWRAVFSHADAVTYLSDFVGRQFRTRFRLRPGLRERVSYLSLDTRDYGALTRDAANGDYLLVVGNAFAHKHVQPTVQALSLEFPRQKIIALGLDGVTNQNVVGYKSGQLSEEELDELFVNAKAVIFPSFYEGFGIPIIRSLSCRKPLFARSSAVNRELSEKLGGPRDFILYDSTAELIEHLRKGVPAWTDSVPSLRWKFDWATSTEQLGVFLRALPDHVSFQDVLVPRLHFVDLLRRGGLLKAPGGKDLESPNPGPESLDDSLLAEAYEGRIKERDQRIQELNQRNLELSKHRDELQERFTELKAKSQLGDRLANERENEVKYLESVVRDREMRIQSLTSSLSWVLTAPLRSVGAVWLKVFGSRTQRER
jgi:GT2 family glycosyltransferase